MNNDNNILSKDNSKKQNKEKNIYKLENIGDRKKGIFKITIIQGEDKDRSVVLHEMPLSLAYFNNIK
jgi:hypothetical protein